MRKRVFASNRQFGIFVLALALVVSIAGIAHRTAQAKSLEHSPPYIVSQAQVEQKQITYSKPKPLRPNYKIPLAVELQEIVWNECQNQNIDYDLVLAVFKTESGFRTNATNPNTDGSVDQGISQINSYYEEAYREHAINYGGLPDNVEFNVYNPEHNIRAGIGGLVNLRNYWKSRGVTSEEDLVYYILGSYNRGIVGFNTYVKRNKTIVTPYAKTILQHKYNLEKNGTF